MNLEELQLIVRQEIKQREEEGCSVGALRAEYEQMVESEEAERGGRLEDLLSRVEALESPGTHVEPSVLEEIRAPDAGYVGLRQLLPTVHAGQVVCLLGEKYA